MRGTTLLAVAVALPVAACQQTVYLNYNYDGSVPVDTGAPSNCSGQVDPTQLTSLEIVVAMDRSMGMNAKFGDTSVLAAARDTIDQYAAMNQSVVRFGYVEFPGNNFFCTSTIPGCCSSSLAPPSQTIDGFDTALRSCDPPTASCQMSSQRATTDALKNCAPPSMQPGQSGRTKRFVLLITNGQPDCNSETDTPCNDARNVANSLLTSFGVETFVVAPNVSDTDTTSCLQSIAAYGGGKTNFTAVFDQGALNNTIDGITHYVAQMACQLNVSPAQIRNPETGSTVLYWKGQVVPYNPQQGYGGWAVTNQNGSTIGLSGLWCQRLIEGGPGDFSLLTGCDPTHR